MPGIHCLRMRINFQEFLEIRITIDYVRKTSTSYPDLYYSSHILVHMGEFELAVAYALERVDHR